MRIDDETGLRCPGCATSLAKAGRTDGQVVCTGCGSLYPAGGGVLDLLPERRPVPGLAQRVMEWAPLVSIYESRLWRRSPLFALLLGISFERESEVILENARLSPSARVLDLACGPGIYTRQLARAVPGGRVVGLDLSWPMLRYAADKARTEHLENVVWVRGDASRLPFEDQHFDVVNCCGALHLFPELERVLAEVVRVLKPGGRFTASAVRRGEAGWSVEMNRAAHRAIGLEGFGVGAFTRQLEAAGLGEVRVHHARRIWQVVSGVRGALPAGA